MRKQVLASLAAILISGIIALAMFGVGINALINPNSTSVSNSPAAVSTQDPATASPDQAQIAQLQSLISQYQAREKQYQAALQNDNNQLNQAAAEVQTIQQLLAELQNRGLIQIDSQGQIFITGR